MTQQTISLRTGLDDCGTTNLESDDTIKFWNEVIYLTSWRQCYQGKTGIQQNTFSVVAVKKDFHFLHFKTQQKWFFDKFTWHVVRKELLADSLPVRNLQFIFVGHIWLV